jgi:pimeloyl-ACP methyl ester carboxylesterase
LTAAAEENDDFNKHFTHGAFMGYSDGLLDYADGLKIRFRLNEHEKDIPAVFIHGAGHNLDEYSSIFPYFDSSDVALNALELRGHGSSGGEKLHISDFSDYVKDLKRFVFGHLRNRPLYIIAEGSSIITAVSLVLDKRFTIKGIAAVNPAVEASLPFHVRFLSDITARFFPRKRIGIKPAAPGSDSTTENTEPEDIIETRFTAAYMAAYGTASSNFQKEIASIPDIPFLLITDSADSSKLAEHIIRHAYRRSQKLSIIESKNSAEGCLHSRDKIEYVEKITRWVHRQENLA